MNKKEKKSRPGFTLKQLWADSEQKTQPSCEVQVEAANREAANTEWDDSDQVLQAVKFTDKRAPALHDLDEDLQAAGCFTEVICGYQ